MSTQKVAKNYPLPTVREKIIGFGRPLNPKELAGCLGVTDQMVRKQARIGAIPHFRIGTSILFDPAKVCVWFDEL